MNNNRIWDDAQIGVTPESILHVISGRIDSRNFTEVMDISTCLDCGSLVNHDGWVEQCIAFYVKPILGSLQRTNCFD